MGALKSCAASCFCFPLPCTQLQNNVAGLSLDFPCLMQTAKIIYFSFCCVRCYQKTLSLKRLQIGSSVSFSMPRGTSLLISLLIQGRLSNFLYEQYHIDRLMGRAQHDVFMRFITAGFRMVAFLVASTPLKIRESIQNVVASKMLPTVAPDPDSDPELEQGLWCIRLSLLSFSWLVIPQTLVDQHSKHCTLTKCSVKLETIVTQNVFSHKGQWHADVLLNQYAHSALAWCKRNPQQMLCWLLRAAVISVESSLSFSLRKLVPPEHCMFVYTSTLWTHRELLLSRGTIHVDFKTSLQGILSCRGC